LSEYERWEARHAAPEYAFGKDPNYFLASCKALLPRPGRAFAVADREGRNGVWLAQQGLDIVSIDFSSSAQEKARALAAERHVHVDFQQVDVHAWTYPEVPFHLYTCAILMEAFSHYRDISIVEEEREIHEGTSHGGMSAVISLMARK